MGCQVQPIDKHNNLWYNPILEYDIFRNGGYAGKPQPTTGMTPERTAYGLVLSP